MKENGYTDCYVAFLDLLGFKNRVDKEDSFTDIFSIFLNCNNPIKAIYYGDSNNTAQIVESSYEIKKQIMSDSICFYIEAEKPMALFCLLVCCGAFQAKLLALNYPPVLLRGGIAKGELYAKDDLIFGPALVSAYQLENSSAKFPRIILTKELFSHVRETTLPIRQDAVDELVYEDTDSFLVVDCFYHIMDFYQKRDPKTSKRIHDHIEHVLGYETDDSIRQKYLYLKRNFEQRISSEVYQNA